MTNDRDTHFAGFAESHYLELSGLFAEMYACLITNDYSGADQARYTIKERLAQRAYDLVVFALDNVRFTYIKDIPDLTEWPTTEPPPVA